MMPEAADVFILLSNSLKTSEKAKSSMFILDRVCADEEWMISKICLSTGLSVPVPRGRKGKKLKNQLNVPESKNADWMVQCNPEVVLHDESYKKHLKQHCNKLVEAPPA